MVGTGTAASCTETALDTALAKGGIVTFDCGARPITIVVTSEKALTQDTVIDGGGHRHPERRRQDAHRPPRERL